MSAPIIPRHIVVHRTENIGHTIGRVSSIRTYDTALRSIFPLFIVGEPEVIGKFTEALSKGFSRPPYGPFWPSFASVNDGRDKKVLWMSEASVQGLRTLMGIEFYFQLEDRAPELIDKEGL